MILYLSGLACVAGPPPLEEWQGEILIQSRIMDQPDMGWPHVYKGINSVLRLETRWGKLPIITDTEQFGNFGITLPSDMRAGESLSAENRRGYLRIGGQVVVYDSREIVGTIQVVEVTQDSAVLDLNIVARAPVVDLNGVGERPVQGRVRALFKEGSNE